MSIKQMSMVFDDTSIKGNEKLLMLSIADNCNDTGVSFPSWGEIMRKTSMSRGSISKWLNELENKGLLFRKERKRINGSNTSNKYLIYPHKNKKALDEEDYLLFKELFISSEVELPSSEVELPNGGQSSEVELLEPSLTFNHHSNQQQEKQGQLKEQAKQIITHLNNKTNKNFRLIDSNLSKVTALLNNKYTVKEIMNVVDVFTVKWIGTEFEQYLRPSTLFNKKFDERLNSIPAKQQEPKGWS